MTIIPALPNNLQDGTVADAVPVMGNFNAIVNAANANAAHNGANTDITSLANLTTPLSVPQGGTGSISGPILRGYLSGLGLSNDSGSPTTTIDFAIGTATGDDAATLMQMLTTPMTKVLAATWASGNGANGLDTGSPAASTWYYVYVISQVGGANVDVLFSLSASTPTLPATYTVKRLIGAIKTDASTHILAFTQRGDEFMWSAAKLDVNGTSVNTGGATLTLPSVPPGLMTITARCRFVVTGGASSTNALLTSSFENIGAGPGVSGGDANIVGVAAAAQGAIEVLVHVTNASPAQVQAITNQAGGAAVDIVTVGWFDTRGK